VMHVAPEELIGGGRATPVAATDATVTRGALSKGEPLVAPSGRADDFSWPRGAVNVGPAAPELATVPDTGAKSATRPKLKERP
jgi:hypothetical protein